MISACISFKPHQTGAYLESAGMHLQPIAHDRNEFRMNLILVLLIVSFELIKFGKHDSLFRAQVTSNRFANVRYQRDHD